MKNGPKMAQERQDLTTLLYFTAQNTVTTDLAPQVARANRGGPGERKESLLFSFLVVFLLKLSGLFSDCGGL